MELDPDMLIGPEQVRPLLGKLSLTACYSFTGRNFILIVTL